MNRSQQPSLVYLLSKVQEWKTIKEDVTENLEGLGDLGCRSLRWNWIDEEGVLLKTLQDIVVVTIIRTVHDVQHNLRP